MFFKVWVTLHASRVEKWIRYVKKEYLDAAPTKCVSLDCEFTDPVKGVRQKDLLQHLTHRAVVLQLSVASETLVFQICVADSVPELLREFLSDPNIRFCGAAIQNDVSMMQFYGLRIANAINLQTAVRIATHRNNTPSLYALANSYCKTNLPLKARNKNKGGRMDPEEELRVFGWGNPLSPEKVHYAALDAHLGFEIARRAWRLDGYNRRADRLNLIV